MNPISLIFVSFYELKIHALHIFSVIKKAKSFLLKRAIRQGETHGIHITCIHHNFHEKPLDIGAVKCSRNRKQMIYFLRRLMDRFFRKFAKTQPCAKIQGSRRFFYNQDNSKDQQQEIPPWSENTFNELEELKWLEIKGFIKDSTVWNYLKFHFAELATDTECLSSKSACFFLISPHFELKLWSCSCVLRFWLNLN